MVGGASMAQEMQVDLGDAHFGNGRSAISNEIAAGHAPLGSRVLVGKSDGQEKVGPRVTIR